MKIGLVLLTMNELDGSKALFDKIPWEEFDEKIVLDGNSTDGTYEFYKSKGIAVISQKNKGLGNAVIEAMNTVTTDAVVFFHPDGNMDSKDTLKFKPFFEHIFSSISKGKDYLSWSLHISTLSDRPRHLFFFSSNKNLKIQQN